MNAGDHGTERQRPVRIARWVRPVWVLLGIVALAFGGVGVLLPVLPTTPFVILAAFFFSRGSPRLDAWLENSRVWGPILADWRTHGAIAPRYKALAVVMMAAVILASFGSGAPGWVLGLQALLIVPGAGFVLTRPHGG